MQSLESANQYLEFLGVSEATTVTARTLNNMPLSVTRITRSTSGHGLTEPHQPEDAFMIAFQLRDHKGEVWLDGTSVETPTFSEGNFSLYDLNRSWIADMNAPFDAVNFHIPRAALDVLTEDVGGQRVETLNVPPLTNIDDATMRGLVHALLPVFENPGQTTRLFLDHMAFALSAHLAITYGEAKSLKPIHGGGLAEWQIKRAIEMIDANLDGDLHLDSIASSCGLSIGYFARAFKLALGMPPHQWLLNRRIEKAKNLMRVTTLNLSDIALACGFCDQSHFSRAFARIVGSKASDWRRSL